MSGSLEEAYVAHAEELIRYATAIVGPDDAADVVIDAMMKVFEKRGDELFVDPAQHLRAYLVRTVYHRSLDHKRAQGRRRRRDTSYVRRDVRPSVDHDLSLDAQRALDLLSSQQRTVTFLVYWCDHSTTEVADILGVTTGTVHKQLARARDRLKEVLDGRA